MIKRSLKILKYMTFLVCLMQLSMTFISVVFMHLTVTCISDNDGTKECMYFSRSAVKVMMYSPFYVFSTPVEWLIKVNIKDIDTDPVKDSI